MPNRPEIVLQRVGAGLEGVKDSLITDPADNFLHLVGDQDTPGASKYYGTDSSSGKGYHSFPTVPNGFTTEDGTRIKTKVFDVGTWNMDTTDSIQVVLDQAYTQVLGVKVTIMADGITTAQYPLDWFDGTSTQGGIGSALTQLITLYRKTGGVFDDPAFSGSSNRGYLTLTYIS